ncbi:MAG: arginine-tRNA-protein transferase [Candidatus Binatia bacterium]
MNAANDDQNFLCLNASPVEMDQFWADGWRHFGIYFFRYRTAVHCGQPFSVMPLRVDLERFAFTRSQKRVLAKNCDARIVLRPTEIDAEKDALFNLHRHRFKENVPNSLDQFLSPVPASVPCLNLELCVYHGEKLIAETFLDVGQTATSAVYAMFNPAEMKKSLGILMMLRSIEFSRANGFRYYYPGYAYHEPFAYDYKKRFRGLEYLDWEAGWKPYVKA